MSIRISPTFSHMVCVQRSLGQSGRDMRAVIAHPTAGNLLRFRAETLLYHALLNRTMFLGRILNLEG